MRFRKIGWTLVQLAIALSLLLARPLGAQMATTPVTETVYHADGTAASGTLLISWGSFTAANGAAVPGGTTTATIGTGGVLSVALVPNAGATPIGSYYTVVYHLDDGSVTREFWVVPVSAYAVQVSAIKSTVMPLSVAQQTVSKAYVDTAIATAVAGHPLDTSNPYVLKAGDTMTGALVLPGDPASALQASDKQYVDEQAAALTGGLAQKVSTLPTATQTVAQPVGTSLAVNNLNGVEHASQYVTGPGNNGIANATAGADCANGCEVKAEQTYASTEQVAPATWNSETHVQDARGGATVDTYFNPQNPNANGNDAGQTIKVESTRSAQAVRASGSSEPVAAGLSIELDGLAGGSNLYPQLVQGAVPYFKYNYQALQLTGRNNTLGQHGLQAMSQTCYAVGDCLMGGQFLTSSGGFRDDADEGTHPYDVQIVEDSAVFEGTCASGCTAGSTSVQLTVTANPGTQGEGRYLIDTNAAKVLTTGVLTGGSNNDPTTGLLARQPIATFTGTSFPVSTLLETAQVIPTQATVMEPGTVTVAIASSGVPAGFQTNTAALPAASGVACVTDAAVSDGRPLNYEMAPYTTVDASHLQMTLNKAHATGATVAVGGLCGFGLEQTVDTSAGIRQVFPVVASTSATTLLYAGGQTAIVGVQGNTSSYLNVNLTVASIARSGNVVTVTTAGNLPVDVNGLTLAVAGVTDSSYNGSFSVTTTGTNTFTYAQSGANSSSTGGSATLVTGGFVLYPMAEVLGVYNAATKAIDGQMTLAANNVQWAVGDTVEQPHYFQQSVLADTTYVSQTMPRATRGASAGIWYQGNNGPGLVGWQIANRVAASQYSGNGGTHTAPSLALQTEGVWSRTMELAAGEDALIYAHCNSHGCGSWNSPYNLFELDSSVGVDTMRFAPGTSTLTLNLRGTQYGFTPQALTAGTIDVTTLNAGTINGAITAASLPVFGPSGAAHAAGAVPDPGAVAGTARYLREDGSWVSPNGALPAGVQCEIVYAGGSGTTWPATVGGFTTTLASGTQAPTWVNGGLFFTMANNQYATLPGGCLDGAQTVMLVYTADATQLTNDVVPGGNTEFGVMLYSDSSNQYMQSLPGLPNQGPNIQNFSGGPQVQTLDHATGPVDATLVTGSNPLFYLDGRPPVSHLATGSAVPWTATGSVWLGGFHGYAGLQWGGTIHAIVTWPTQLTEAQVLAAHQTLAAALAPYGVFPEQKQEYDKPVVIWTGDSITADSGWAYQYFNSIPAQAMAILGTEPNYYNMAHGGYNTPGLIAEFPQTVAPMLRLHAGPKYVKLAIGTNDINNGTAATSILTSEQTYCGMVNAMSASCAVTTVMPATRNSAGQETQRQALNAALVAGVLNGSLGAVALSDWHNDPIMGNAGNLGNTCYFYDGLHPGYCNDGAIRGADLLARRDALAVHRMTNPQVPYWLKVTVNQYAFTGVNATSYSMPLLQLMPREKVCGVTARVQTALAGAGITALTETAGNSLGSAAAYSPALSVALSGVQDNGYATGVPETGVVSAYWTATGANLSAINAGTMDFDICVVTQP